MSVDVVAPNVSDNLITGGDNKTDNEEPIHAQSESNLNIVPNAWGGYYTTRTRRMRGECQLDID